MQGGARYGYALLWVVLLANLIAMLVQYLAAKLGIVTGKNLPEMIRAHFPRPFMWCMWVQAEIMAMATDIAEFLGAAIALYLLFGVPPAVAGLITALLAFGILGLQSRGYRRFEVAITALLAVVLAGFIYETLRVGPSVPDSLRGFLPGVPSAGALYLAVGIVGATVMPHVVYLHSALVNARTACTTDQERSRRLHFGRFDVIVALGLAGAVNIAMLAVAARLFHVPGLSALSTLQQAHDGLARLAGGTAALVFSIALLASGLSSSSVGTYAGQIVMAGFTTFRVPLLARRAVTMVPALIVLAVGMNATSALVLSQVVLSFGIPFALVPLVMFTSRRDLMGSHANGRPVSFLAWTSVCIIAVANTALLWQQLSGRDG